MNFKFSAKWALSLMISLSLVILVMSYLGYHKITRFQEMDWQYKKSIPSAQYQMVRPKELYHSISLGEMENLSALSEEVEERSTVLKNDILFIKRSFSLQS